MTTLLWIPAVFLLAQDVEIVAVSDSLSAPDARGAVVVSTGGTVARAANAHEKLRDHLPRFLEAAGYRVLHLAAKDLAPETAGLREALSKSRIGMTGAAPILVERKIAFFGAENRDRLPKDFPEGTTAVLLTHQDPVVVAEWMRATPRLRLALVGGHTPFTPDPIRVAEGRHVVLVPRSRTEVVRICFRGGEISAVWERVPAELPENVRKFCAERGIPWKEKNLPRKLDVEPEHRLPDRLEPDRNYPLAVAGRNRAVRIRIHGVSLRTKYAGFKSPTLLVDSEWENGLSHAFILERKISEGIQSAGLREWIYIVVNGRRAFTLPFPSLSLPGHGDRVNLETVGSIQRMNLLFELPPEKIESVELRFYDLIHGHVRVPLVGSGLKEDSPLQPVQSNDLVELGVYGVRQCEEWEGRKAPAGSAWLLVDLRARGRVTIQADATAFDPSAKAGAKTRTGLVGMWIDPVRSAHLLVEGKDPIGAEGPVGIPVLPDLTTGAVIPFLVPASVTIFELRWTFGKPSKPISFPIKL